MLEEMQLQVLAVVMLIALANLLASQVMQVELKTIILAPQSHFFVDGFQLNAPELQRHLKGVSFPAALYVFVHGIQTKVVPVAVRALLEPQSHI
jgi:hypothetical protein